MTSRTDPRSFLLALVLLSAIAAQGMAQDPFGDPDAAPAPAAPPAAGPARPAGPPPTDDLVILSIRESAPTTPAQLIAAVRTLMNYGAFDEARRYLVQLLGSKPTAGQLAMVQREFGSAFFIRLAAEQRLAPEGAQVAEGVMRSARQLYDSPDRLRALAAQTGDDDPLKREEAIVELRNAGSSAVAPLLGILGNTNLPNQQAHARDALVSLGQEAVEPLIGVLESNHHELRTQAIAVLTRLKTSRVVPYLLRPAHDPQEHPRVQAIAREALKRLAGSVPSKADVEDHLYRRATEYLEGMSPLPADPDGLVILWRWDNQQGATVPRFYPANPGSILLPEIRGIDGVTKTIESVPASTIMAAVVARDLYALFPQTVAYKRLFLVAHLEAGKLMAGLDAPLPKGPNTVHALVSLAGVESLEEALEWSIKNDHFIAAIAAAEILGDIGDATLLTSRTGALRPLASALRHPDRRLRFAAADAIMKLNSSTAFPGASYVAETLGYFAGTVGTRRALVADPRIEQGRTLGGLLSGVGYDVDVVSTGNAALGLALQQPDYEVVFLGDAVDHPDLLHTWQQLRKDPRTANLLVAFLFRPENMLPLLEKAESDDLARAMPYVYTPATLNFQLEQLFRHVGTRFVPYTERQRQAATALDHLARLANNGPSAKHYDLLRHEEPILRAVATPGLTLRAVPVLGGLATPAAQLALVNVASDRSFDILERQAAAKAFDAAVQRRGILLTTREIGAQYDRYNLSELQDEATQQVLAALLDTIEARAASN